MLRICTKQCCQFHSNVLKLLATNTKLINIFNPMSTIPAYTKNVHKNIYTRIKACGPISIADYMKEVLTHPTEGYYMSKDVIGPSGDFITSPEISQMFGEIIGVWMVNELHKITEGSVQLVELGPGRGTMINDVLRVFNHFKLTDKISVHLVEISPKLSKIQAEKLCVKYETKQPEIRTEYKNSLKHYMNGITKNGVKIFWYYSIADVPKNFSIFLAHEFFDALPIHKFQKVNNEWCEVMIDIDPNHAEERFRYVLIKGRNLAKDFYIDEANETRDHVEVSPQTLVIVDTISTLLNEHGGFALIIDYGHDGSNKDTFRAFKNHKQHDPLNLAGSADLTADVDFSVFKKIAKVDDRVECFGPIKQNEFLKNMGIDIRMEMLLKIASEKQAPVIKRGYNMIMNDDKMGSCFKVLSMFPLVLKEHLKKWPVAGFQFAVNK